MTTVNKIKEAWRGKLFIEEPVNKRSTLMVYTTKKDKNNIERWFYKYAPVGVYLSLYLIEISRCQLLWWKYIKRKPFYERVV